MITNELMAIITGTLPELVAQAEKHTPGTKASRAAVARLHRLFGRMRRLARESQEHRAAVEKLIGCYLGTLPALSWPFDRN
jgi:hypothetical protein